jgi:phosphohistidine phosphatase
MELILWRHADAEDGSPDSERQLTPKGIRQAARMGKWLSKRLPGDARILVSPAQRARQTARGLSAATTVVETLGTKGSVEDLLLAADWPHRDHTVVVVGHQPTLGETAALLLTGRPGAWEVKKSAIIWISSRDHHVHLRAALSVDLV